METTTRNEPDQPTTTSQDVLGEEGIDRALFWMQARYLHVQRLVAAAKLDIAPSGSCRGRPDLWKPEHWRWFQARHAEWNARRIQLGVELPVLVRVGQLVWDSSTHRRWTISEVETTPWNQLVRVKVRRTLARSKWLTAEQFFRGWSTTLTPAHRPSSLPCTTK